MRNEKRETRNEKREERRAKSEKRKEKIKVATDNANAGVSIPALPGKRIVSEAAAMRMFASKLVSMFVDVVGAVGQTNGMLTQTAPRGTSFCSFTVAVF